MLAVFQLSIVILQVRVSPFINLNNVLIYYGYSW